MTSTTKITRIHARVNGTSGLPEASGRVIYQTYKAGSAGGRLQDHNGRLTLIQKGNVRFLCRPFGGGRYIATANPTIFARVDADAFRPGLPVSNVVDIRDVLYVDEEAYQALAAALDELLLDLNYSRHLANAKQRLDSAVGKAYNALQEEE